MTDTTAGNDRQPRLDYAEALHKGMKGMIQIEAAVQHSSLDKKIFELVKMRASQINGCAFCLDMHAKDARAQGETEQRLYTLSAWRETDFFSPAEEAALAWCEALTLISEKRAPQELYDELEKHFGEEEIAALTYAIVAINGWNRLAIGFHSPVGDYVSPYATD